MSTRTRTKTLALLSLACVLMVVGGLVALRFVKPAGRTILFPEDRSMGGLKVRDRESTKFADWVEFGDAQGEVIVPEGKQVSLFVTTQGGDDISPLANLRPDDLQVLFLPRHIRGGDLVHIGHLTGLRKLVVAGTVDDADPPTLTDEDLIHLGGLSSLEVLTFKGRHAINGSGLAYLSELDSLKELTLSGFQTGDSAVDLGSGLAYLSELDSLKELRLAIFQTGDSAVDLTHLSALSSLNSLYLFGSVTDQDLAPLKNIPSLRELYMISHYITDGAVEHLKELRSLKSLAIEPDQISQTGMADLKRALPNCRISFIGTWTTPTPIPRDGPIS